jgi:F-type H+-transporting ATPase subunit epsilon
MASTMQFDLVSPERRLASVKAREVRIPGADGDLTAMPDHAPVITTLRPGILTVVAEDGTRDFAVTGGFAEITPEATSVLAERAIPVAEVKAAEIDALIAEATAAAARAPAAGRDDADKLVADLTALKAAVGV